MKSFYKALKIIGIILVIFFLGSIIYISASGPELPPETDSIIEQVMKEPLPELVTGNTGYAQNGDVSIWYEHIEPEDTIKGSIILSMGISEDAMGWPPAFLKGLVKNGYRVIRYDYRGCGMSDWLDDWTDKKAYNLSDMSNDGLAVLDALNIEKAHFVGVSMGGMIAQLTAIEHPERVMSLTSIMSSGYITDPNLPGMNINVIRDFIFLFMKYGVLGGEQRMVKLHLASRYVLKGESDYNIDIKEVSQQVIYNIRKRKGYNLSVSQQHNNAVYLSGSRYEGLMKLTMPVLIIHGKADNFVPLVHGKKCADLIPNAETLWVEGMGHDIPLKYNNVIIDKIIGFIEQ